MRGHTQLASCDFNFESDIYRLPYPSASLFTAAEAGPPGTSASASALI